MKPSDLPFAGRDNEYLRVEMAKAISRAEISVDRNGGQATEHANSLKSLFNAAFLYLDGISPSAPFPQGIDQSTVVVTPTATGFGVVWENPVQEPGALPVDRWKLNVRAGTATSGTVLYTTDIEPDEESYTYAGPALTAETQYTISLQGIVVEGSFESGTGLAFKTFTTTAA